jgi:hypothetical protein
MAAGMDRADVESLKRRVQEDDAKVFDEMKASNLYEELAKGLTPDAAIGTVGIHIDPGPLDGPPECMWVSIAEMEIALGAKKRRDSRFIVQHCCCEELPDVLNFDLPRVWANKVTSSPYEVVTIRWGWWRIWRDRSDEVWQHVVMLNEDVVHSSTLRGRGSCAFIFGRFGARPERSYGWGPTMQGLFDQRYLDELRVMVVKGIDKSVDGPVTYPSDSFVEMKGGFDSGMLYPIRPGEQDAIKPIFPMPNMDPAFFDEEKMERRLKRLHFIDKPEQRGDTPPTAAQWLSEMELGQRRFGVPGRVFWREFCADIFSRFVRIMEDKNQLSKFTPEERRAVRADPINPAQRSQDMQDVANATRVIEIGSQAFPEEWKAVVDGEKTLRNFVEKLAATGIITFRDKEQVAGAVDLISKLVGGQAGGGAPAAAGLGIPGLAA